MEISMPSAQRKFYQISFGYLLALLSLIVILSGCGPIYETRYNLTPPPGQMGQICANQCDQIRLQCIQNEDQRNQNCETQNRLARLEYEQCRDKGYSDCYDSSIWCDASDHEVCEEQFRMCYRNCGGTVQSYQVCVFGCN